MSGQTKFQKTRTRTSSSSLVSVGYQDGGGHGLVVLYKIVVTCNLTLYPRFKLELSFFFGHQMPFRF